jgi:hypothetical protein
MAGVLMKEVIMTLIAESKNDRALRVRMLDAAPFAMRERDGNTILVGTCTIVRRSLGRKHGKRARYWIEVLP